MKSIRIDRVKAPINVRDNVSLLPAWMSRDGLKVSQKGLRLKGRGTMRLINTRCFRATIEGGVFKGKHAYDDFTYIEDHALVRDIVKALTDNPDSWE